MGVVLLHILQWILRIILFLLLLIVILVAIILIVPIRYQVEGEFLEKKPRGKGKITWFFYLIYMTFVYEEDFRIQVRVFGFKVFDSKKGESKTKNKKKSGESLGSVVEETSSESEKNEQKIIETCGSGTLDNLKSENSDKTLNVRSEKKVVSESITGQKQEKEDKLAVWEREMEAEAKEEVKLADKVVQKQIQDESRDSIVSQNNTAEKEKKSLSEKIESIKLKIQNIIQKVKDIIAKIQEGKLKAEHYLELWNRKETQITFGRAKKKLGRMIKEILPRKWKVIGELGFSDPCTTGQLMGALGAMYPILGNKVQIVPNFENEVMNIEGNVKGHIRLGNLLYQLVSLILHRQCFKFIKLVFAELGSSKKSETG